MTLSFNELNLGRLKTEIQLDSFSFLTHYSRSTPFRSIMDLSIHERQRIFPALNEDNTWGLSRFFHPSYLDQRARVESWMRSEFEKKGGAPSLANPVYFFLGVNEDFESHPKNKAYRVSLSDIDNLHISFSLGDSMFCFCDKNRTSQVFPYGDPIFQKLYVKDDLSLLIQKLSEFRSKVKIHIEAQLWITPAANIVF